MPKPAGEAESFVVLGLQTDRIYYFVLRAFDDLENVSPFTEPARGQTGDPAPPGRVVDLHAEDVIPHAFTLAFTAPGDDGDQGTAVTYVIRRFWSAITEENWSEADSLALSIPPQPSGERVEARVAGLEPNSTFHYAVRARDDAGKVGEISNDLEVTLPADTVPPGRIEDLVAQPNGPFRITLNWTAPGNDGGEGRASSYQVRYAAQPVTEETWSQAVDTPGALPQPGDSGTRESMTVLPLEGGATLWFGVRAVDDVGNVGVVSNTSSATAEAAPRTWRVNIDGTGDAPTIQAAIDRAQTGDMVLVAAGRYFEDIDFLGKGVYLKSDAGPEETILDGTGQDSSVVMCFRGEPIGTVLEGFTITNGQGTAYPYPTSSHYGGGLWCPTGSVVVRRCVIRANSAFVGGGGLFGRWDLGVPRPTLVIEGCRIEANQAQLSGGGIYLYRSHAIIRSCAFRANLTVRGDGGGLLVEEWPGAARIESSAFYENIAGDQGGGVYAYASQSFGAAGVVIRGNLFVRNEAHRVEGLNDGSGGGMTYEGSEGEIVGNTFAFNVATGTSSCGGGGIRLLRTDASVVVDRNLIAFNSGCGIACWEGGVATFGTNLLWQNTGGAVGGGGDACPGNWRDNAILADPEFCNAAEDDYSVSSTSPALATGLPVGAFTTPGCTFPAHVIRDRDESKLLSRIRPLSVRTN